MARKRYNKGNRLDMRQGGRVALARGSGPKRRSNTSKAEQEVQAERDLQKEVKDRNITAEPSPMISTPARQDRPAPIKDPAQEEMTPAFDPNVGRPIPDQPTTESETTNTGGRRPRDRTPRGNNETKPPKPPITVKDPKRYAEQIAGGRGPSGEAVIPDAEKVGGIDPKTGQPVVRDMEITTMTDLTPEQKAQASVATAPRAETVTTGTVAPDVQAPADVETATMEAAQVTETPVIDAQTGEVSPQAIAQMQDASLTLSAEGINVNQQKAADALVQAATGTLSPEAKAEAAKIAGTNLPRVLRAKKQLRRAGLSEDQINLIGNDPEVLEDELMDYSEEERGMIAGLPEEALISTQLNSLLEGMESGEVPVFARPAVAAVNEMLAQRGLDASTVGRDALFNAIIQSAMPLAQSNAQSIKESVMSQRNIEAQAEQMNAQMRQQTALSNADKVFNMDMTNLNNETQARLSNSKFLQTIALTDASQEQQAVLQNAANMSRLDLAELDANTRLSAQNAQAFLNMDMANLNNKQQTEVLKAQQAQQRMLSNQAASNAAAQFNAASENQTNQFMANLSSQIDMNNAARNDAMSQFNATQNNAAEARRVGIEADISKFNSQLVTQVDQFNAQQDFARNQWNAQNAAAVEASNVEWRRQANTINTAAQNAINAQNAQNAFQMSSQALAFLWQELRDQADFDFRAAENEENRKAQIVATALANEGKAGSTYKNYLTNIVSSFAGSLTTAYAASGGGGGSYTSRRSSGPNP